MSAIRYPDKFWNDVRDCWESNPKISITGALKQVCDTWGYKQIPSSSSAWRRQTSEMWQKYGKNTAKINAKTLKKAIAVGKKNISAIDKEISDKKQNDAKKNCTDNAVKRNKKQKTENDCNTAQKLESNVENNQEDTGLQNNNIAVDEPQSIKFHDDGSIEVSTQEQEKIDRQERRLYARKQTMIKKLNTALVIDETRRINFGIHEYTSDNLEALRDIREKIIECTDETELDLNRSKLRSIISIIEATSTLQRTVESNAKVSAVFWGLDTDNLKDMQEVTQKRNSHIVNSKENLEKQKKLMLEQKRLAFEREVEIIQAGDDITVEE